MDILGYKRKVKDMDINERNKIVLENLHVIDLVIRTKIDVKEHIQGLGYEDLYQTGCIALCKAAETFENRASFRTYAFVVVKNSLMSYIKSVYEKSKNVEYIEEITEFAEKYDYISEFISDNEYDRLINVIKENSNGVALKGVEAIDLKVKGYSGSEIAKIYGVKPNHVSAWIARTVNNVRRKKLLAWWMLC